ncbi:hypothetical protein NPIL_90481 [Nephila pilipes]|uniref:Uncharacterized protein n=1 Tax=Nephila pilipes TaxID=299642 RepID=A0A8X6U9B7_NEPPI|nr:hypothetical protein NPIL_90481 [Nephila pilipes]
MRYFCFAVISFYLSNQANININHKSNDQKNFGSKEGRKSQQNVNKRVKDKTQNNKKEKGTKLRKRKDIERQRCHRSFFLMVLLSAADVRRPKEKYMYMKERKAIT